MKWIYSLGTVLFETLLPILSFLSPKLKTFRQGREFLFQNLAQFRKNYPGKLIWFHVASLGEYEQAKPVIASLKEKMPDSLVLVSFFSPSGYIPASKKKQENVDYISYLPIDTAANARRFLDLVNPNLVFFVKYDLWYHFLSETKSKGIPLYLIAAAFRQEQPYFKRKGFFRNMIFYFDHIFTSNQESIDLLSGIGYSNHSLAGDTRFDRVSQNALAPKSFPEIENWKGNSDVIVLGSIWEEDMELLIPLIQSKPEYKWIIAPHDIRSPHMISWASAIPQKSLFYSKWDQSEKSQVLFIDNIGMLSSLYQYAKTAYVGGAFGEGLHNILEPLGFQVPVFFGKVKRISKFPESEEAVQRGCGFSVKDKEELAREFELLERPENHQNAVKAAKKWVDSQVGAANRITDLVIKSSLNER